MMNLWVKLGAVVAAIVVVFVAGLWINATMEEADQADILRKQIRVQIERQDRNDATARRVELELAEQRKKTANLYRRWSAIRETPSNICPLTDSRIRLLKDATAASSESQP